MKLAIVGSRRRNSKTDEEIVQGIVLVAYAYWPELVVVSGGCKKGADAFAKKICDSLDIPIIEHLPDLQPNDTYLEAVQRYYKRNYKIAEGCDALVALVADDRKGGTENTIKYARKLNRPVFIVSDGFPREEGKALVAFLTERKQLPLAFEDEVVK